MNTIKFNIINGKLKLEDPEKTIVQNSTDTALSFNLTDDWEECDVWCLIKTNHTNNKTFRLPVENTSEGYLTEIPPQLTKETFLKISLYGTHNGIRIATNEIIIGIERGGYIEYKPPSCHDRYPHHGQYHHHHCFPYKFMPVKTEHPYHPHLGSPKSPWGDSYHPVNPGKFGRHGDHPPHHIHKGRVWDEYHVDIFEYILTELKESINHFTFDDSRCYAYHDKELLQIIPFPNFVTREELDNFFGDVVDSVELDEETGDLSYTTRSLKN